MRANGARRGESVQEAAPAEPEARAAIDYGPLERRLGYFLRRAQIAVFRDFFASFATFDIRPAQYSVLTVVERNPGLKQTEVGDALAIKRANLVPMIDELEARGLMLRDRAPKDKRGYALRLTAAGGELIRELHAVAERHELNIAAAVGSGTYSRLLGELKRLAEMEDDETEASQRVAGPTAARQRGAPLR